MPDASDDILQFIQQRKAAQGSLQSTNAAPSSNAPQPPAPALDPAAIVKQLAPLTAQALNTMGINALPSAVSMEGNLSWFDRNQRKDEQGRVIPIDTERGINLGDYGRMVWQRRPEERIAVLRKMFPDQIVRLADTGEPIVEIAGPGGAKQDVLVNPPGFNAHDLLEIGSSLPETTGAIVGSTLGAAGGAAIAGPPGGFAGRIIGGAAGAAFGGMTKDVTARAAEQLPVDFGEIVKARSDEAEANALVDLGLSGASKALRVGSPFAGTKGPLEFNLRKAQDYFQNKWGEAFEATPGELSGSTLLRRIEATEVPQPGASTILGNIRTRGEQSLMRVFNRAVGARSSEEQLGNDLIKSLRTRAVEPAEQAVIGARDALVAKGENELVNTIDTMTGGVGAQTREQAGEAVRSEFKAAHAAAKAEKDAAYAAVKALPGGTSKILSGNPVADAADEILKELPKVLKTEIVPAVDAYGNPVSKTVVKKQILASGRPEGLAGFLSDMKAQRGQKMTIDELTVLKNAARDEIAKTEAVPGVKDRWFGIIEDAYDKATKEGVAALPTSNLKDALENARNVYKTKFAPFDREGLHDILRRPNEGGFQSPEQLVSRLFSGVRAEHNYRVLKETLGPTSNAFNRVKRSVLDNWMLDASDPLTKRIDPTALENAFTGLRKSHPEIYKDVVGGSEQQLFQITRSLKAAGKEIGDLDPAELSQLIRTGSVTRDNILKLRDAQRVRDTVYANPVLEQIKQDGALPPDFEPIKFVRSLFNTDIPMSKVQAAIAKLPLSAQEDLRTATLYRVLTKAGEFKSDFAPSYIDNKLNPVSGKGLVSALGAPGSLERQRNELLLGPDNVDLVKNAISALSPRELTQKYFGAAGGMSATTTIEKLLRVPLQYASSFARKFLTAFLYTTKTGEKLLLNEVAGPKETAALANMLVASEPFLRKMQATVGNDAAYSIVNDLKASIDKSILQDQQPSQANTQRDELLKFIQTRKGKVKMTTTP